MTGLLVLPPAAELRKSVICTLLMVAPAGIAPAMSKSMSPRRGDDCALVPAKIAWPPPRLLFRLLWKIVLSLAAPIVATSAREAAGMAITANSATTSPKKPLRFIFLPSEEPDYNSHVGIRRWPCPQVAGSSDVQCPHLLALIGTTIRQKGHSFDTGSADAGGGAALFIK